jgi:hypothetical protein
MPEHQNERRALPTERDHRMTQAVWNAAKAEVMAVLNGARYDDGGKVLSTEDALVLSDRVVDALDPVPIFDRSEL